MTSVVRYKCPGCANIYKDTAGVQHLICFFLILIQRIGIINHLKTAGHANVPAVITKEGTRVEGFMADGKFELKEPQAQAADTAASHSTHSKPATADLSWEDITGLQSDNVPCISVDADGKWKTKAEKLFTMPASEVILNRLKMVHDDKKVIEAWKSAVSAFLTMVNDEIPKAQVSELQLLSNDKLFVQVPSAPSKYSAEIALLLCSQVECGEQPGIEAVQDKLLALLEDSKPIRKEASCIVQFCAALLQSPNYKKYRNPDNFQKLLTFIKHGLKCAALIKFRRSTNAIMDASWAAEHIEAPHSSFQELQYWKRRARNCIVPNDDQIIRWLSVEGRPGIEICTNIQTDTWVRMMFQDYCDFVNDRIKRAEDICILLGCSLFTEEEMKNLKDPQEVPIGYGLMRCNSGGRPSSHTLPMGAQAVLDLCFEGGNKYAMLCSSCMNTSVPY
jgi:hypothetical protein